MGLTPRARTFFMPSIGLVAAVGGFAHILNSIAPYGKQVKRSKEMEQNNDDLRNRFTAWMQVVVKRAKIDGMGFWKIFFTIILPLSKPALIAQFIFGFVAGYNNYTGALLYLNNASEDLWTLQIALQKLIAYLSGSGDYNFLCATALMAMLPLIVVYIACQKFFVQGITFGGGKE